MASTIDINSGNLDSGNIDSGNTAPSHSDRSVHRTTLVKRGLKRREAILTGTLLAVLLGCTVLPQFIHLWGRSFLEPATESVRYSATAESQQALEFMDMTRADLAWYLDVEPIQASTSQMISSTQAEEVGLTNQSLVVGLTLAGKSIAIPLQFLSGPNTHLVQISAGDQVATIAHCDLSGCTRVFGSSKSKKVAVDDAPSVSTSLNLGGLSRRGSMVLLFDGVRYPQESKAIPLQDLPHEITTWHEWLEEHPNTRVWSPTSGRHVADRALSQKRARTDRTPAEQRLADAEPLRPTI